MRLRFDDFILDTSERVLLRGNVPVAMEPKVFECIALLASEAGKLTSTDRLRRALWPDLHVGAGALRRLINAARKVLGDTGTEQAFIRTRTRLGYVFVRDVARETGASDASATAWPFVGRKQELQTLADWLGKGDGGGLCFVSGEAGAGKSSLLARLAAQNASDVCWLFGHCRATLGHPAFWPFRELAGHVARDPLLRSRAFALADKTPGVVQLVPELAASGPGGVPHLVASADQRFALYEALAALLRALSQIRALVLVIEDVHWADEGSLAVLDAVARVARQQSLHVFATYRPEAIAPDSPLAQLIGRTSGRSGAFSVHLPPLGVDALIELLAAVQLPGSPARAGPTLQRLTGGNALYVHELVRHVLTAKTTLEDTLPPSLTHVIGERVRSLPQSTRQRLDHAAILGDEFDPGLLAAAAGTSRAAIELELEPAQRSGLLCPSPHDRDRLRFGHALVHEALRSALAPELTRAYHGAALRALLAQADGGVARAQLAVHAFESGDEVPEELRRQLCEQAGREAFAALAFDGAALHLGRALELTPEADASIHAAELALLFAKARWHADHAEREVDQAFSNAARRARRAGATALLAEAALGFAVGEESSLNLRMAALRPEARDLVDEAWQRLTSESLGNLEAWPDHIAYRLAAASSWLRADAGDPAESQRAAVRALALAPDELEPIPQLWMLGLRALAEPEHALSYVDEIVTRVQAPGLDPRRCIEILIVAMATYLARGELAGYERAASEIERLGRVLPEPARTGRLGSRMSIYRAVPLVVPVLRAVMRGELAAAERVFWSAAAQTRQWGFTPSQEAENDGFHMLLQLYGYLGKSRQLAPLIEQRSVTHPEGRWFHALLNAQFALERGELAEAAAQLARLRESGLCPTLDGRALPARAETLVRLADVCAEVGTKADAALLYDALASRADYYVHDGLLICWGACARPLGALALQLERLEDAERHYARALAMNLRIAHRPELVRTQLGSARLLLATGRADEARTQLGSVQRDAEGMAMTSLAERARALIDA